MPTRRGEIFTIAVSGNYGKPRPALVIQAEAFDELPSVTVLRITSELIDAPLIRIPVAPDAQNGLRRPSQIMVDKAVTVPRIRLGPRMGRIDTPTLQTVDRSLKAFFGLEGSSPKR
ncbi:MAG: type II toxin-antitoxin system PemK/MazF family toxin [Steroidobacteraceae bacterium]